MSRRSRSKVRSASATFPRAASASMSSAQPRSRNGACSTSRRAVRQRARQGGVAERERRAGEQLERVVPRLLQLAPPLPHPRRVVVGQQRALEDRDGDVRRGHDELRAVDGHRFPRARDGGDRALDVDRRRLGQHEAQLLAPDELLAPHAAADAGDERAQRARRVARRAGRPQRPRQLVARDRPVAVQGEVGEQQPAEPPRQLALARPAVDEQAQGTAELEAHLRVGVLRDPLTFRLRAADDGARLCARSSSSRSSSWGFSRAQHDASTITTDGGTLTYSAAPGEGNSVLVTPGQYDTTCAPVAHPCLTVFESGARITEATGGCVVVYSGIAGDTAACPIPQEVVANLGDRDDAYWDWDGDSRIDAGPGSDNPVFGEGGNDRITGGSGDDVPIGNEGDDVIDGGPGDDYLDGIKGGYPDESWSAGSDTYVGGGGIDSVTYESRGEDLLLSPDGVRNDGAEGENDDIGADVRTIYGGGGADVLVGNDARNDLAGMSGDDIVVGGPGEDQLSGGLGNDQIGGGDGADLLQGDDGDDELVGGDGADRFWGDDVGACSTYSCPSGQDRIASRDGIAEPVNCGPGEDSVEIDADDYNPGFRGDECELIDAAGAPPQDANGEPGGPAVPGGAVTPAGGGLRVERAKPGQGGRIVVGLAAPAAGKVTVAATAKRRVRFALASRTVAAAGPVKLTLRPTPAAKRMLRRGRRVKVSLRVTFTPRDGGAPSSAVATRRVRGSR